MHVEWVDQYDMWCVLDECGYPWFYTKSESAAYDKAEEMEANLGYL